MKVRLAQDKIGLELRLGLELKLLLQLELGWVREKVRVGDRMKATESRSRPLTCQYPPCRPHHHCHQPTHDPAVH